MMVEAGKVLVVEDDAAIDRLISEVLRTRGYEIRAVSDGLAALAAALEMRPDVVLLDIGLPGLDGFGVLARLKDHGELAEIPVIMMTAWADPELVTKALDRGAHEYVRKPFDVADFGASVDAAVRMKTRHRALSDERMHAVALADALTALPNRRALSEELERQVASARRSRRDLAVLVIDLDDFENINDTYGRCVADGLLRAVARRVAARVRSTDVIGRWGRHEFVIVAPDTNADGACALAEDLRAALAARPVDTPGAAVRISASIGVADWCSPRIDDSVAGVQRRGESADALLGRCSAALQDAQRAGRNAVRLAPSIGLAAAHQHRA